MNYHTIITHESPDLDAMLSCLLLKKYGAEKFPGVAEAKVIFVSAGSLYQGKSPNKLLKEGIITVDTGGGKFDTHPDENKVDQSKLDRSAADLVAEYLGVIKQPSLAKLIEYTRLHDSTGFSLNSKDQLHHLVSIQTILYGFKLTEPGNDALMLDNGLKVLDGIISYYSEKNTLGVQEQNNIMLEYLQNYLGGEPNTEDACYEKLLEWEKRLRNNNDSAFPSDELDLVSNLRTIVIGAYISGRNNGQEIFRLCTDAIVERERKWLGAIKELETGAVVEMIGTAKICYLRSANPLLIKASRFVLKADLTIYQQSETEAITILVKKFGPFSKNLLGNLIKSIRVAECTLRKIQYERKMIGSFGEAYGWFFHQSGNLIINGSDKARSFEKSLIKTEDLLSIVYADCSLFLKDVGNYNYPEKFISAINKYKLSGMI